jgi:hypothetical protein
MDSQLGCHRGLSIGHIRLKLATRDKPFHEAGSGVLANPIGDEVPRLRSHTASPTEQITDDVRGALPGCYLKPEDLACVACDAVVASD